MNMKLIFKAGNGEYKVPECEVLYRKNFEYFHGMGLYDEALCQEKALLTTGYNIVRLNEQD